MDSNSKHLVWRQFKYFTPARAALHDPLVESRQSLYPVHFQTKGTFLFVRNQQPHRHNIRGIERRHITKCATTKCGDEILEWKPMFFPFIAFRHKAALVKRRVKSGCRAHGEFVMVSIPA